MIEYMNTVEDKIEELVLPFNSVINSKHDMLILFIRHGSFFKRSYTPVNHLAYADLVDMIMYRVSCLQQEQFLVLSEQLRVFRRYWLQRLACA